MSECSGHYGEQNQITFLSYREMYVNHVALRLYNETTSKKVRRTMWLIFVRAYKRNIQPCQRGQRRILRKWYLHWGWMGRSERLACWTRVRAGGWERGSTCKILKWEQLWLKQSMGVGIQGRMKLERLKESTHSCLRDNNSSHVCVLIICPVLLCFTILTNLILMKVYKLLISSYWDTEKQRG